jgi:DNA-directed RNA polymerase specialized sigma24 family protein
MEKNEYSGICEMENIKSQYLDSKAYQSALNTIRDLCGTMYAELDIFKDAANFIILQMMKSADSSKFDDKNLRLMFPRLIQDLFEQYRMNSFNYCLVRIRDPEVAEEIAQEAIFQLLSTKTRVSNVPAWLRQVTHNLLCAYYKQKKADASLYHQLKDEEQQMQDILNNSFHTVIDSLSRKDMQEILQSREYKDYEGIIQHPGLQDFARAEGISYEAAKKRRAKAFRDIKALLLKTLGWENTQEILNYNQYQAIQKFIRALLDFIENKTDSFTQDPAMDAKLKGILNKVITILEWEIFSNSEGGWNIVLVCNQGEETPLIATINIQMNKRNQISLQDCKRNELAAIMDCPVDIVIPTNKGKCEMSLEDLQAFIKQENKSRKE